MHFPSPSACLKPVDDSQVLDVGAGRERVQSGGPWRLLPQARLPRRCCPCRWDGWLVSAEHEVLVYRTAFCHVVALSQLLPALGCTAGRTHGTRTKDFQLLLDSGLSFKCWLPVEGKRGMGKRECHTLVAPSGVVAFVSMFVLHRGATSKNFEAEGVQRGLALLRAQAPQVCLLDAPAAAPDRGHEPPQPQPQPQAPQPPPMHGDAVASEERLRQLLGELNTFVEDFYQQHRSTSTVRTLTPVTAGMSATRSGCNATSATAGDTPRARVWLSQQPQSRNSSEWGLTRAPPAKHGHNERSQR